MDKIAWVLLAILAGYLFYRWSTLDDIKSQLSELTQKIAVMQSSFQVLDDVPDLKRQITLMHTNLHGIRKKLGFDDGWADMKHLEQEIAMLQRELSDRKRTGV